MDPALEVRLLGAIEIIHNGQTLTLPTRKANLLFAHLVLHRCEALERTRLAGLLWPDSPEARARRNLNTETWRLRQALGDAAAALDVTSTTLAFEPPFPFTLDIEPLDPLPDDAPEEQLRRAAELYRGDFLAGYYEDWVVAAQERLRAAYQAALARLLENARRDDRPADAVRYAGRILEIEPLRESIHRELIEIHLLRGDRAAAMQQYRRCANILHRELGVAPMPETQALHRRLVESLPRGLPDVFVGREQDLARLDSFASGTEQVMLIAGEAGSGKTALVKAWAGRVDGAAIISVLCPPPGEATPFAPIAAALGRLHDRFGEALFSGLNAESRRQLARFVPGPASAAGDGQSLLFPPSQARERLFGAVGRAFRNLDAPLILILDDLHNADADSLALLQHLLLRTPPERFRMIGAYQPESIAVAEGHPLPDWLTLDPPRRRHDLWPLSPNDTGALLQALAQTEAPPSELAARLFIESEGNPLWIMEMLRDMFDRGVLVIGPSGGWGLALEGLPEKIPISRGIEAMIRKRLDRLPAEARNVLIAAAVLGRTFEYDLLLETSRLAEDWLQETLELAGRASIIRERRDGVRFTFVHEKFRTVLLEQCPPDELGAWYGRAAKSLETLAAGDPDESVERLAHFYAQSNRPMRALPLLKQAIGKAEALHAYELALDLVVRALQILAGSRESEPAEQFALELRRLAYLGYLGRFQEQLGLAPAALSLGAALGPRQRCEAEIIHGRSLIAVGSWREAEKVLHRALRHARRAADPRLESEVRLLNATLAYHTQHNDDREADLQAAHHLAERAGDDQLAYRVRLEMAANQGLPGPRANGMYEAYLEARARGNFVEFSQFVTSLVINLTYDGRYGMALDSGEELVAIAEEHGLETMKHSLWRALARCRIEIGDYAAAQHLARKSMIQCRLTGYRYGEMRALACLAASEAGLGSFEQAMPRFDRALRLSEELGARREWFLFAFLWAEARLMQTGDAALRAAWDLAEQTLAAAEAENYVRASLLAHHQLARLSLRRERPRDARNHSTQAIACLAQNGHAIGREHQVLFTHAQCLRADGEANWLPPLKVSRADLAHKACSLPRGRLRRGYLEQIPIHREIARSR